MSASQKLTRIGVFYDGNFFRHVSNYYVRGHARQARISIAGLHDFLRHKVAEAEGEDVRFCQVVDAHYFRGRISAQEADERDLLLAERSFEDVLMRAGVTTHYLPMGSQGEKGIDVWLALEAFELAMYKRFDVLALIACDGDFVPLVRKLNTLGTRVMLLGWDFTTQIPDRGEVKTRTAQALLNEVTYPIMMNTVIDDRALGNDTLVKNLFLPRQEPRDDMRSAQRPDATAPLPHPVPAGPGEAHEGSVQNLKEGYGFISPATGGPNIFFPYSAVSDGWTPADLWIGAPVVYEVGRNNQGPCAERVRLNQAKLGQAATEAS